MDTILLTGATGFIGSNIANYLLEKGFTIFATHRTNSSFERCHKFKHKINWINTDLIDWEEQIKEINPDQFIHVAWSGIDAGSRDDWEVQLQNFRFSKKCFDLAKACNIPKVIAFGSQAEYGPCGFSVDETTVPKPTDAYGAVKTLTAHYLRNLFENTTTEWYWVRVFSVFGENENPNWLLPTVISKLNKNESIKLTSCEQRYNYLYIGDFLDNFFAIVQCSENKSGIYNLCNGKSIQLKDLLVQLADCMNVSAKLLLFDALPLRPGQNMMIEGDNSKFKKSFREKDELNIDLHDGLMKTIEYFKNKKA